MVARTRFAVAVVAVTFVASATASVAGARHNRRTPAPACAEVLAPITGGASASSEPLAACPVGHVAVHATADGSGRPCGHCASALALVSSMAVSTSNTPTSHPTSTSPPRARSFSIMIPLPTRPR